MPDLQPENFQNKRTNRVLLTVAIVAGAIAVMLLILGPTLGQTFIVKPYQIPSAAMLPTIQVRDRVLANRLIYRLQPVQRGDIIVFTPPPPLDQTTPYVKRVVGLPGDTVEIKEGKTLVNGEEFIVPDIPAPKYVASSETVPDGMLYVLGDNRNESADSHIWGYVPLDNVIGRAELVYWPLTHFGRL